MEELNKIISGLYAKIDNKEKIIRELQEEIQDLKADYGNLAQVERDFYKQALLDIKEIFTNYEELEKVIGAGKPRFPLYKVQRIVNKAIGSDKE